MGDQPLTPRCYKCYRKHHWGWAPSRDGWGRRRTIGFGEDRIDVLGPPELDPKRRVNRMVAPVRCKDCGNEWRSSHRALVRKARRRFGE